MYLEAKLKTDIYESIKMLHENGAFMAYCSKKRALWYIKRDLAVWVDESSFKLKFTPGGFGKAGDPFYQQALENRCVVCASVQGLTRHHVVPYVFRSRFPVCYKSASNHDVLAVCVECHEEYEKKAWLLKEKLVYDCGGSFQSGLTQEEKEDKKILSARRFIASYDAWKGSVHEKCLEKSDNSKDYAKVPMMRIEELRALAAQSLSQEEERGDKEKSGSILKQHWADKVVEPLLHDEKALSDFIQMWRQHFLDNTGARYMPEHWQVGRALDKLSISS